ncbi:helix-turn-helix domain-containing protein [Streptomyces sp. NPDC056002]|uniref:helix-turn-helix domain-containing protein n=1 Tax=Streptomyces sp. NPDC056002 TaxID=3345675 RepID=UPI0035E17639
MPSTTPKPVRAEVQEAGHTDLGRRIAARRKELGLTRQQVGSRSGVDAGFIAYLEEHSAAPGSGSLVRIADALGTTVAELTGATTEQPPGQGPAPRDSELVALSEAECRRLLSTHGIGRVAVFTRDGPVIFPVNYVVAGSEIAFRTSWESLLAGAAGARVAFEVDHIDDAMEQGWSVLAVGEAAGVTDEQAVRRLNATARSLPWAGGDRRYWMSVVPSRITGRRVVHR